MYTIAIRVHMKTTLNIDDRLLDEARKARNQGKNSAGQGRPGITGRAKSGSKTGGTGRHAEKCKSSAPAPAWNIIVILVDTSVWIEHFRRFNQTLFDLLIEGRVQCHEFVVGELACGCLPDRRETIALMRRLPTASMIKHEEVLSFVEQKHLMGTGIGWVDAHLLASSMVEGCGLWSIDRPLAKAASKLGISTVH